MEKKDTEYAFKAPEWHLIEDASIRFIDPATGDLSVEKIGRMLALQRMQDNRDFYERMTQYRLLAEGVENGIYNLDECYCPNPDCGADLTELLIWDNIGQECVCKSCGARVEVGYTETACDETEQKEFKFFIIPVPRAI